MSDREILTVEGLSKSFLIHERNQRLEAFENINFVATAGDLVGLVGASGSGKSSVLKCIYRTYLPSAGRALYRTQDGQLVDLVGADDSAILKLRRNEIRLVSQFLRVLPRRSAKQLIETTLHDSGVPSADCWRSAERVLDQVGLPHSLWNLPPNTFSGGEKQLVNLAQALAVQPRLLLLDEPTASLDPQSTQRIVQVIEALKSERLAMVGVFHDRKLIARLADRTLQLEGGLKNALHFEGSHA